MTCDCKNQAAVDTTLVSVDGTGAEHYAWQDDDEGCEKASMQQHDELFAGVILRQADWQICSGKDS